MNSGYLHNPHLKIIDQDVEAVLPKTREREGLNLKRKAHAYGAMRLFWSNSGPESGFQRRQYLSAVRVDELDSKPMIAIALGRLNKQFHREDGPKVNRRELGDIDGIEIPPEYPQLPVGAELSSVRQEREGQLHAREWASVADDLPARSEEPRPRNSLLVEKYNH